MKRLLQKQRKYPGALLLTLALTLAATTAFAGTETALRVYDINSLMVTPTEAEGTSYSKVEFDGLYASQEVGTPELPVEYIRFIVPTASKGFSATATVTGRTITRRLPSRLWPVQHPIPANGRNIPGFAAPMESAYTSGSTVRAEVIEDSFIDGCNHVVTVAVYPVSYSDVNLTVKAASQIEVKLSYTVCSVAELDTKPIFPPVPSSHFRMEDIVVNSVSVPAYSPRRTVSIDTIPKYYYIITPKNLEPAFRHLATWKGQKGYNVTLKCIEDIYATPRYAIGRTCVFANGTSEEIVDSAASLRAYLKDEYIARGTYFCLLAGDYRTPMPIRRVRNYSSESECKYTHNVNPCGENYIPTDNYFSDFTTKWNLTKFPKETVFSVYEGDVGYAPDVVIGRLLCSQPKEVDNYLRKLIIYESNPGLGDASYLQNHLYFEQDKWEYKKDFFGEYVLDENGNRIKKGRSDSLLGKSAPARKAFSPFPMTTILNADSCRFYPDGTPHNHKGEDIIKALGDTGYSNWYGHGCPVQVGICAVNHIIIPITSYTNEQIYGKRNEYDYNIGLDMMGNKNKPSIAYSVSCDIAPFDRFAFGHEVKNDSGDIIDIIDGHIFDVPYNFGGAFTVAGDFGGPAMLCNSRVGWFDSAFHIHKEFNKWMSKTNRIGIAEVLSKGGFYSSHARATHHLIGEPEFEMWTVLPKKFDNLTVNVESFGLDIHGSDLLGAKVCTYFGHVGTPWQECPLSSIELNAARLTNDFAVSIWKTGYLPFISLYSFEGTITGQTKEYIVQTAMLGNPFYANSANGNAFRPTTIGSGTSYTVYASEGITAYSNFIIEDGAEVVLDCEKTANLSCTVKAGGKLTVRAKDVKMTPGFKVEKGGAFNMTIK